ncbi:MAG: cytochrome c [Aurantimonas endophytica]|jgi:mono/diheme cytochrome c family protein|uniref:Mono/diheme cytochrome c family protein n=1 Tax=Aurantimonas endophytica TaxID=1522175 RepID=A0A7W6HE96_9HYPH|nr:cytochrome c [Aurantimonas endophytica]MBB4003563.1 mono/diheme cytochrome c family protein [Aurantimonas endophytica]MCO6404421.1 c-type cytochrome [Aurantimonas endophytica]
MRIALLALAFTAGVAEAQVVDSTTDPVERGRILVVANCSGCHEVGLDGDSPNPQAPPFRTLSERFPIDALEETFIGTIDTGHPGMPVFKASQDQIDDVIAYIAAVME